MNIKQHIEAGHYERDMLGRAIVPVRNGKHAVILTADYNNPEFPDWYIVGFMPNRRELEPRCWRENGQFHNGESHSPLDLLPPPPRKRSGWIVLERTPSGAFVKLAKVFETEEAAKEIPFCSSFHSAIQIEWEEPV